MKKIDIYNIYSSKQCGKSIQIRITLKKTCLGVIERGNRDKDNETGLMEGG